MIIFKYLWHALKGICRKPNAFQKIGIFLLVVLIFAGITNMAAVQIDGPEVWAGVLSFCIRWLWVPFALFLLLVQYGEIDVHKKNRKFFAEHDFYDFEGWLPKYLWKMVLTQYLVAVRLRSRKPLRDWEKLQPDLEMLFEKRVHEIRRTEEKFSEVEILLVEKELPKIIVWKDDFMVDGQKFAIGESLEGPVIWDMGILFHGVLAGATRSGKSTIIRCIIYQALVKLFKALVIDMKNGGDFIGFERAFPVYSESFTLITQAEQARELLVSLVKEVKRRLALFKESSVTNIDEYNAVHQNKLDPILIVIDECAELLDVDVKSMDKAEQVVYKDIAKVLRTLARTAAATGVHILLCLIRPDSEILSSHVKNNLLFRASGYFADAPVSRIVLGNDAATELPSDIKGRFIVDGKETQAYFWQIPKAHGENDGPRAGGGGEPQAEPTPSPP